mmetsp:Transcript_2094/g.6234  ORF Transcript_2094/g.6234 Transcript_2094/m.6234 type:complete len:219 (-) Transcript_2094:903-1559(-)
MDEFCLRSEPSPIVQLVLEENACHMILHEVRGVVRVPVFHQKELLKRRAGQRQQRGPQLLHLRISPDSPPQVHPVEQIHLLGRRLLVLALPTRDYAPAPGMQSKPIVMPEAREEPVVRPGVGRVPDEVVDVRDEGAVMGILRRKLHQDGRGDNEVPKVVVVVVVARVPKIRCSLAPAVVKALAARDAPPLLVVVTPLGGPRAIPCRPATVQAPETAGQ